MDDLGPRRDGKYERWFCYSDKCSTLVFQPQKLPANVDDLGPRCWESWDGGMMMAGRRDSVE